VNLGYGKGGLSSGLKRRDDILQIILQWRTLKESIPVFYQITITNDGLIWP